VIGVVINPFSRRNRGQTGLKRKLERLLGSYGRVVETYSTDAIIPALKTFAAEGRRYWIADGGDGALHWMINEAVRFFGAARAAEARCVHAHRRRLGGLRRQGPRDGPRPDGDPLAAGGDDREGRRAQVRPAALDGVRRDAAHVRRLSRAFSPVRVRHGVRWVRGELLRPAARGQRREVTLAHRRAHGARVRRCCGRALFQGPLAGLKPKVLAKAEYDFLHPLRAEVTVDGELQRDHNGKLLETFTVLQCAALPLSISGILRVFPLANNEQMHVHAGMVSGVEAVRAWPSLMTGKRVQHMLPDAYDGPAKKIEVRCLHGDEMNPVLDGEVFFRLQTLTASLGPVFEMAVP
jgi:diacylglycerol kinase family enzyme